MKVLFKKLFMKLDQFCRTDNYELVDGIKN